MNKSTLRNLSIVLFALVAVMVGLELGDRNDGAASGDLLLPGLKDNINAVTSVLVEAPGEAAVRIGAQAGTWIVENRDGYPASVPKIREVLLALADARILERKTSNPDLYAALGVRDPDIEGSAGVRLTVDGEGVAAAVIIGNINQGSNRYVRLVDAAQSLLIDKNPELPADAGGWLDRSLLDIDGAAVRSVQISHADGERIRVEKSSEAQTDFDVIDIPDGRELSYTTVGNGIGSALSDLELDDVRTAEPGEPDVVTTFEAFDGRTITARTFRAGDDAWVSLSAAFTRPVEAAESETAEGGEAATTEGETGEAGLDPAADVAALNARVSGWQFKIPDFKLNQFARRWDDILKEDEAEEE